MFPQCSSVRQKAVYVQCHHPLLNDGAGRRRPRLCVVMTEFFLEAGCTGAITVLRMMGEAPTKASTPETKERNLSSNRCHRDTVDLTHGAAGPVAPGLYRAACAGRPGSRPMGARSPAPSWTKGAAGRDDRPAPLSLKDPDDQIVTYYANAAEAIGADVPFVIQDYPLSTGVRDDAGRDPPDRRGQSERGDAESTRTGRGSRRSRPCAGTSRTARCAGSRCLCGNGGMFLDFETERGAGRRHDRLRPSRTCWWTWCASRAPASARSAHRPVRRPPALHALRAASRARASPCASTCSPVAASSRPPPCASPAAGVSPKTKAEVD